MPFRPEYDCPLEVWLAILDMACGEDWSLPARSLTLVSRRFREISKGHLYYSVKIGSVSQLLELDQQLGLEAGADSSQNMIGTKFMSIILPTKFWDEIFLKSSLLPSQDDLDDESYVPSESGDSISSLSSSSVESLLDEYDDLEEEIADIKRAAGMQGFWEGWPCSENLEDLERCPTMVSNFQLKIYAAIRRLLASCATTLEVFTLSLKPIDIVTPDLFFPVLPRLRCLAVSIWALGHRLVYIQRAQVLDENGSKVPKPVPLLFPSLESLVLAHPNTDNREWLVKLAQACSSPGRQKIKVTTGPYLYGEFADFLGASAYDCKVWSRLGADEELVNDAFEWIIRSASIAGTRDWEEE